MSRRGLGAHRGTRCRPRRARGHCAPAGYVSALLRNPAYKGALAWGTRAGGKFYCVQGGEQAERPAEARGRWRSHRAGAAEAVLREGAHEPLVSPEVWAAAQEAREFNRSRQVRGQATRSAYLLSGFLRCVGCGRPLTGSTHTQRGYTNRYYLCTGYREHGQGFCAQPSVRKEVLDEAVRATVARYVEEALGELGSSPSAARGLREEEQAGSPRRERTRPAADYAAEIERRQRMIGDDAGEDPRLLDEIHDLKRRQAEALAAAAGAPMAPGSLERAWREARALLADVRELLASGTVQEQKTILRRVLVGVTADTRQGTYRAELAAVGAGDPCPTGATSGGSPGTPRG